MQTTLAGTLFVYQGEEIGIRNFPESWDVSEYKDIESINFWKACMKDHPHDQAQLKKDKNVLVRKARDHSRTPMQWINAPHGGFCPRDVEPWMRVNDDYSTCNTEAQMAAKLDDDLSPWQFWQRGLANRKAHADVFVHGSFEELDAGREDVYAYARTGKDGGKWVVVLNFSKEEKRWKIPKSIGKMKGWMAGNYLKGKPDKQLEGELLLKPWEGILGQCEEK